MGKLKEEQDALKEFQKQNLIWARDTVDEMFPNIDKGATAYWDMVKDLFMKTAMSAQTAVYARRKDTIAIAGTDAIEQETKKKRSHAGLVQR